MRYQFGVSPDDHTLIVSTSEPALYTLQSMAGISDVTIIDANKYQVTLAQGISIQDAIRWISSTLRGA